MSGEEIWIEFKCLGQERARHGNRRMGIGRALLAAALEGTAHAVLSVAESNGAARALYRSLGFSVSARRLVHELRRG